MKERKPIEPRALRYYLRGSCVKVKLWWTAFNGH